MNECRRVQRGEASTIDCMKEHRTLHAENQFGHPAAAVRHLRERFCYCLARCSIRVIREIHEAYDTSKLGAESVVSALLVRHC